MSKVDDAIVEINDTLRQLLIEQEGMADILRWDINSHTREQVSQAKSHYDRRVQLLIAARDNCDALVDDGHPAMDITEVDQSSLDDMRKNDAGVDAAMLKFASNSATSFKEDTGTPVPK